MTWVVGVDPSAKKIALVGTHVETMTVVARAYPLYKSTEKQTNESIAYAQECMEDFTADTYDMHNGERAYAWTETPVMGVGPLAAIKQAYVGGIVIAGLVRGGYSVYQVNNMNWKKDIVGHGKADKAEIRRVVDIKWPKVGRLVGEDGDLWDAAGICLYGQEVLLRPSATSVTPLRRRRVRKP